MLAAAWEALGGDPRDLAAVRVTPADPAWLPSRLPALEAMTAAVACSTLAAAVLDAARAGGGPAPVLVDARHVAVAARSERHARTDGVDPGSSFAPLSRFWRARDGWVRLHGNYPWHRDRALAVLGCAEAGAGAAIAERGVLELEGALAAASALGFAVRTPDAWAAHPQGRVRLPLVENARPGDGVRLGPGRLADGVRVLDLTRVIAGPVATRTLAAWGADVLRLDPPALPEFQTLDTLPGKQSALLDLATDRATLERLLGEADVLVQGYRPGALRRFGLDAADLAVSHPHLVVVTISAWGSKGPWAQRRGFDSLVQCPTGIAHVEGAGGGPGALPAQVLDHATGYLAAAAALLGLARGGGASALSLAQTAAWLQRTPGEMPAEVPAAADDLLVRLDGAGAPVTVVAPPGRVAGRAAGWTRTTTLGADPPAFA